jgi:hypothetical protein
MAGLIPHDGRQLDRRTGRTLDALDSRSTLARARDRARAERAAQRISDLRVVTNHGLGAVTSIGVQFEQAAQQSPVMVGALLQIALSGAQAIKQQVDDLGGPLT